MSDTGVVGLAARGVQNLLNAGAEADVFSAVSIRHLKNLVEQIAANSASEVARYNDAGL